MYSNSLKNKNVIVTGSNKGIGKATLEEFAKNVANVFDVYDPPHKTDRERLAHIEKAKSAQARVQAEALK